MNEFSGRRVLITGGLGFIGSNLARSLVGMGARVTLVDSLIPEYGGNPWNVQDLMGQITINVCDVRDSHAMAYLIKGQDWLFNLAGQTSHLDSMSDPKTDLDINAVAQLSILEGVSNPQSRPKNHFCEHTTNLRKPDYLPVDEQHPIRPVDVNGINKVAGESYHLLYNQVYGLRASVLRLTNTYGPGMRVKDARQTFLGIWMRRILEGKPILVYGDGSQLRDFTYVDDCVDALLRVAASDEANGKVYNLGSREMISLSDLAGLVVGLHGSGAFEKIVFPPDRKAIDIGDYYSDYRLIEGDLGWAPSVDLREGIQRTLNYYQAHRAHYWDAEI